MINGRIIIRAIIYLLKFCGIIIGIDIIYNIIVHHQLKSANIIFDIIFGFLFWILFLFSDRFQSHKF